MLNLILFFGLIHAKLMLRITLGMRHLTLVSIWSSLFVHDHLGFSQASSYLDHTLGKKSQWLGPSRLLLIHVLRDFRWRKMSIKSLSQKLSRSHPEEGLIWFDITYVITWKIWYIHQNVCKHQVYTWSSYPIVTSYKYQLLTYQTRESAPKIPLSLSLGYKYLLLILK